MDGRIKAFILPLEYILPIPKEELWGCVFRLKENQTRNPVEGGETEKMLISAGWVNISAPGIPTNDIHGFTLRVFKPISDKGSFILTGNPRSTRDIKTYILSDVHPSSSPLDAIFVVWNTLGFTLPSIEVVLQACLFARKIYKTTLSHPLCYRCLLLDGLRRHLESQTLNANSCESLASEDDAWCDPSVSESF